MNLIWVVVGIWFFSAFVMALPGLWMEWQDRRRQQRPWKDVFKWK